MNKNKGVRKYGRLRQGFRWTKYRIRQGLFVLLIVGAMVLTVAIQRFFRIGPTPGDGYHPLFLLSSLVLSVIVGRIYCMRFQTPKGHLLNPLPPEENSLLPDVKLLVRASSSAKAQPAELLRAAQETAEEKPEELLRISGEIV